MNNQLHNELRKEFQLERLILFSDAVFAIAITLLVIEIKIPSLHGDEATDQALLHSLKLLIPKFVGFIISFLLIGLYWVIHHRMFGFVTAYNHRLLVLNLFFLFFIVLMPFSTGFYSEFSGPELFTKQLKIPFTFYVLNFCCVGFVNYMMWRYIMNPKHKLAEPPIDPLTARLSSLRSIVVPVIFFLALPVAYFTNVIFAVYMPMLIPIVIRIMRKRVNKKYKPVTS